MNVTKFENNYRPAAEGKPRCRDCKFLLDRAAITRCAIIGDQPGKSYAINKFEYRCDRFQRKEDAGEPIQ